ncbi:MAG: hypothetical protein A2136_02665 [Chloroflexi bacterium RBG_16_54_11]|nr:MAG: hypothetical protein A2136_02665 [Chloroflexi bacterium RBG_16_54_11]
MTGRQLYSLHASICQTLSNPKRLEIIDLLRDGEMTVNGLAASLEINQANLSQHLAVMRQKGIVTTRRDGLNIYYRLSNPKITQACDLMRQVLLDQLSIGAALVQEASRKEPNG